MYANIKYEVNCPNSKDCNNEGAYLEQIQCGEIRDEETGQIIDIDWDLQPCECQFCTTNKSSIFNGGTIGYFSMDGLLDSLGPQNYGPFELTLDGEGVKSFNELHNMHGKRIAIFMQTKAEDIDEYTKEKRILYKFKSEGRCLGKYIFHKDGSKHLINLNSFIYLYFPALNKESVIVDTITLTLSFN